MYDSRWHLRLRSVFPPYVWHAADFVRAWPPCHLDRSGHGRHGVVPLRPLSAEDAPRVRAYADTVSDLPYEEARTRSWPLPGGVRAWEALARAAMFQFPGD
ncbi:hypothetical protein ABZ923_04895 [Streptomyces sp. NPDC046881]|uniref:hypothetical protein n=1 Tax=Streptomyces sp. NPDC046881 TaxID=3155374 RepID=UPI0033C7518A